DRDRTGVRLDRGRAMPVVRDRARPRGQEVETGTAPSQMPASLPLPSPPDVRLHECPHSDLVSVLDSGVYQRSRVAGADDGWGGTRLRAAGELFPLAGRPA